MRQVSFARTICWITLSGKFAQGNARRSMTVRVAINGFGRIGRNVVRALYESGRRAGIYRGGNQRTGGCCGHGAFVEI
ncbi:hypothetical protein ACLB1M_22665 [Escherichia coli]